MKKKKIYCYSKAAVMVGHGYSDDVAVCRAVSMEDAMRQFLIYYDMSLLEGNVYELKIRNRHRTKSLDIEPDTVSILTSY